MNSFTRTFHLRLFTRLALIPVIVMTLLGAAVFTDVSVGDKLHLGVETASAGAAADCLGTFIAAKTAQFKRVATYIAKGLARAVTIAWAAYGAWTCGYAIGGAIARWQQRVGDRVYQCFPNCSNWNFVGL